MVQAVTAAFTLVACGAPEAQMAAPNVGATEPAQAQARVESSVSQATPQNRPCLADVYPMLDAIHFACNEGRRFTVHYEEESWCAVVFAGGEAYVLPQTVASPALNTDGHVEFRPVRDRATLTGAAGGPYDNCRLVE